MDDLGQILKEGVLEKKSPGKIHGWQKRTFRIYKDVIRYSDVKSWNPKDKQCIQMSHVSKGRVIACAHDRAFQILVVGDIQKGTTERAYDLRAASSEEAMSWCEAIRNATQNFMHELTQNVEEVKTKKEQGGYGPASLPMAAPHDLEAHSQVFGHVKTADLPVLPTQFPMFEGSWVWLRKANDEKHRSARLQESKKLQEAFAKGGYVGHLGGHDVRVTFSSLQEMLKGTMSVSMSAGLPAAREDPKHKMEVDHGGNATEKAVELTLQGYRTVTVNAASAYHAGGGFTSGGRHALEEAFCTQSTLYPSLETICSTGASPHIPEDGVILSPRVEIFRHGIDQGYQLCPKPTSIVAVISMAMYNKNPKVRDSPLDAPSSPRQYEDGVRRKFEALYRVAIFVEADALIVPDVGCGVFGNDAVTVGRIAGDALKKYSGYFRLVHFTGRHSFFEAATTALRSAAIPRPVGKELKSLKPNTHCIVCGKHLGIDLAVLLAPTGQRASMQFLHLGCSELLKEKWPGYTAMALPRPTDDTESFLCALDVDGNGILEKEEARCAMAAIWPGDLASFEQWFEDCWQGWLAEEISEPSNFSPSPSKNTGAVIEQRRKTLNLSQLPPSLVDFARLQHGK
eukprot:gnl/MRDRNA2_/MRDRNA2_64556_c1_seq1.p1 gnl/MRDRNA2_/MRDRNA2_64556_c1~~gnl/MRDRNA2_/MRDRNA2_64556_c1_seq1.p1  ORF type:complete len:625 (+),score=120.61 gnl/MRDRNA2_/MRDRNA2_64556_c1_seq1:37-1911(+)